jgi:16S rRNA (cytosine1402-N4)-methyltransferase
LPGSNPDSPFLPRRRRLRYSGKYPRRFEEKYKELQPERYAETVAKVLASGKTPAGTHRPIMVQEILEVLAPQPGQSAVDCTLGYGGHATELLKRLQPGGRLLGLDVDPIELPKTETRLRQVGYSASALIIRRYNFAGLAQALAEAGWDGADVILADLGVSSMQLDDPARGFSMKLSGPLDMRLNPQRGLSAAALIEKSSAAQLMQLLKSGADEPNAAALASALAGHRFATTSALTQAVAKFLHSLSRDERELCIRRVFQALRIAVNDEFSALDALLRQLPACLSPGGRVAILTFHSGEDRRVKKALAAGLREGSYASIAPEVIRPSAAERHANPRSASAKLRWARKALQP